MAIQQRKQSSIILTFKVLQFVHQLRRRVKPRASNVPIKQLQLGSGVPLSHKGLRIISKELAWVGIHNGKHVRRVTNRVRKSRKSNAKRSLPDAPTASDPADELQRMLGLIDDMLNASGTTFSSIARSDRLFLKHNSVPILEGCSLNQTVQLLVAVQDAVDVLVDCRSQYGDDLLLSQGADVGLCMDENFIANYEHMLLRLRKELIEALARKALEELLHGGHDKKQRKMLAWFTEFAEKPRPLSTTFPWNIKTSLAVLWGVCWMFYNSPPSEEAARVRQARVLQHLATDSLWNAPASSDYLELGRALIGSPPQHNVQPPNESTGDGSLDFSVFQARNTDTWEADLSPTNYRLPRLQVSQTAANRPRQASQVAAPQFASTYYTGAQDLYPIIPPQNNYLPHFQGDTPLTVFPHLGSESHTDPWHQSFGLPQQQSPRHQLTSPQTPSILVTRSPGTQFAQPHEYFASFNNPIYSPARQPEASPLHLNTSFHFAQQQQAMMGSNLSPDTATMQGSQIPAKHERNGSVHSIPTPVSNSGPISPLLSPTSGERRIVSSPQQHRRHDSVSSSEQDGDDDGSLRKNYSYKRAEEPLRNQDGKMMCRHNECMGLLFDRKCEWSKHMDKHDRPYKCTVKGCEKLQGFTYSGGLLRHEREVHKLHGGTKKSLFCPFADCKRSSGTGFTRKENLAEHIRRVHRRTSMSADMHGLVIRRSTIEGSPAAESSESPYNRPVDYQDDDEMTLKRKRGSDSGLSDRGNDEMRAEIKRLRHQNEEKDERLRQLEQAVMALQQNRR